jgi:hypothetical protein
VVFSQAANWRGLRRQARPDRDRPANLPGDEQAAVPFIDPLPRKSSDRCAYRAGHERPAHHPDQGGAVTDLTDGVDVRVVAGELLAATGGR